MTLVPPEPKPVLSLTYLNFWGWNMTKPIRCAAYHCDKLRVCGEIKLETNVGRGEPRLVLYFASLDVVWKWGASDRNNKDLVWWRAAAGDGYGNVSALCGLGLELPGIRVCEEGKGEGEDGGGEIRHGGGESQPQDDGQNRRGVTVTCSKGNGHPTPQQTPTKSHTNYTVMLLVLYCTSTLSILFLS